MMKNFKKGITSIGFMLLMVISTSVSAQKNNPFNEYGLEHNTSLEYIYEQLKELRDSDFREYNAVESKELLLTLVDEYFTQHSKMSKQEGMPNEIKSYLEDIIKLPPPLSPTFPDIESSEYVSEDLISKSKIIFDFTQHGNSTALESNVNIIQKSKFTESEKAYLLVLNSIAFNSLNYWNNNASKWMKLSSNNLQTKSAPPGARIAAADVGGGVAGALVGGSVTVVAFGIGAVPGWVVGAAGASAAQGMVELVDWLW